MTLRRFKPRKYGITRELLEIYRAQGEGPRKIAKHFPGCTPSTVRNWLIRFGMDTELPLIGPVERVDSGDCIASRGTSA